MHTSIPVDSDKWLYRRSHLPETKYLNPDGTATSRVFKLRPKDQGELSVNIASLTTLEASVMDPIKYFLFEILNKSVLEVGLFTFHAPLEDGSNDAHAVIVGMDINEY
jgi:hypothetical protein